MQQNAFAYGSLTYARIKRRIIRELCPVRTSSFLPSFLPPFFLSFILLSTLCRLPLKGGPSCTRPPSLPPLSSSFSFFLLLLSRIFLFISFLYLGVARGRLGRERATRANAPQRHGSTHALRLIDAFIVRTVVGLFALTKHRLASGRSVEGNYARLEFRVCDTRERNRIFFLSPPREILRLSFGTSIAGVWMKDWRREGRWWRLFGIPSLRESNSNVINIDEDFRKKGEKFSKSLFVPLCKLDWEWSINRGKSRERFMLVWNCLRHSTRGERKGFTKYRTNAREVFPFGREKVNLIVSLLHCLSLDRLSWKSWRIYSNVFQRTKFHRSYIYVHLLLFSPPRLILQYFWSWNQNFPLNPRENLNPVFNLNSSLLTSRHSSTVDALWFRFLFVGIRREYWFLAFPLPGRIKLLEFDEWSRNENCQVRMESEANGLRLKSRVEFRVAQVGGRRC